MLQVPWHVTAPGIKPWSCRGAWRFPSRRWWISRLPWRWNLWFPFVDLFWEFHEFKIDISMKKNATFNFCSIYLEFIHLQRNCLNFLQNLYIELLHLRNQPLWQTSRAQRHRWTQRPLAPGGHVEISAPLPIHLPLTTEAVGRSDSSWIKSKFM